MNNKENINWILDAIDKMEKYWKMQPPTRDGFVSMIAGMLKSIKNNEGMGTTRFGLNFYAELHETKGNAIINVGKHCDERFIKEVCKKARNILERA